MGKINLKTKILIAIFLFLSIVYLIDKFFDNFTFVNPVKTLKLQWVIQKRYHTPVKTEKPLKSPVPLNTPTPTTPIKKEGNKKVLRGIASHYNRAGCIGCNANFIMANGKPLIDSDLTIALTPEVVNENKLLNDLVRIKNVKSGQEAIVKVTDTGGFGKLGRVADLTDSSRDAIGCDELCEVEVYF